MALALRSGVLAGLVGIPVRTGGLAGGGLAVLLLRAAFGVLVHVESTLSRGQALQGRLEGDAATGSGRDGHGPDRLAHALGVDRLHVDLVVGVGGAGGEQDDGKQCFLHGETSCVRPWDPERLACVPLESPWNRPIGWDGRRWRCSS